ncbi:MAG: alanine racemase [Thermoanaerobaculia bacterium]
MRATRALVDLEAIASNSRLLKARAAGREILPVVKADAYGHGAVPVARRLEAEGARRFAVAILEEGIALRRGGICGEILILVAADPEDAPLLRGYGLTPAVHDLEQARRLARAAASFAAPLPVHVKLDTGMGRLGVRPEGVAELARILRGAKGLEVTGAFTQLASGEDTAAEPTASQLAALSAGLATLSEAGLAPSTVHVANSGGILAHPEALFDCVRPGLALYGVLPSDSLEDPGLAPAMQLETRVAAVKNVPAGTPLGYGGTFVTSRPSRIAALPIGYHDGFRRSFSGRAAVLLREKRAPVVGVVSMDLTLVDATESGADTGDRVVLMGRMGPEAVTAWELARAAGTIPWEILCGVGARVPRVYAGPGAAD